MPTQLDVFYCLWDDIATSNIKCYNLLHCTIHRLCNILHKISYISCFDGRPFDHTSVMQCMFLKVCETGNMITATNIRGYQRLMWYPRNHQIKEAFTILVCATRRCKKKAAVFTAIDCWSCNANICQGKGWCRAESIAKLTTLQWWGCICICRVYMWGRESVWKIYRQIHQWLLLPNP